MNNRTFNREQAKRALLTMINQMDAAATAEAAGDFIEMARKDKNAAVLLSVLVVQVIAETEEEGPCGEDGYFAEALGPEIEKLRKQGE